MRATKLLSPFLNFFVEQVKLLHYKVSENMRQIPAAACVARFWAQPPISGLGRRAKTMLSRDGVRAADPLSSELRLSTGGLGRAPETPSCLRVPRKTLLQRYGVIFTWFWRLWENRIISTRSTSFLHEEGSGASSRLGSSLQSHDLEGSINGPKEREKKPELCA